MKKEIGLFRKRFVAGVQLNILIISLFAFSFLIWESDSVNAADVVGAGIAKTTVSQTNVISSAPVLKTSAYTGVQTFGSGGVLSSGTYTATNPAIINYMSTNAAGITSPASVLVPAGETVTITGTGSLQTVTISGSAGTSGTTISNAGNVQLGSGSQLTGATPGGGSTLSNILGAGGGTGFDALYSGLQWAGIAYLGGQMLGSLLGLSSGNTEALSTSLSAGAGVYKSLATLKTGVIKNTLSKNAIGRFGLNHPGLVGLGLGVTVLVLTYKKETTKTVEFNCLPWQAPTGGNACEECNDADLPCSEYRCKSLGQNCELVNEGTDQEKCVAVRNDDVIPPVISPNIAALSEGYKYANVRNSPPGPGFEIVNLESSDGCLKAFTPLEFGVDTDEPAQCKIDYKSTGSFDEMEPFMGGSNLYLYNHTDFFSLPGAKVLENSSSFNLENGKDLTFFIRCQDKNGNENAAEYAVKFCVDPAPDTTAPVIEATSVTNGGCVAEDQTEANVEFYTNEPAQCRWSPQDQDYDNMQGEMDCNGALYRANSMQLFTCSADLTGISRDLTKFYVRCKDQPGEAEEDRNENKESFEFSLRGSTGLRLKNLQPNETIFGGVRPSPVELYAETTFGCNNGRSVCFYAKEDNDNYYIQFFDTNTEDGIHTQRLNLDSGNHEYFVKCVDEGGNVVKDSIEFKLDIDENAPVVARVYEEDGMMKVVTVRDSECVYTNEDCDYSFEEGTEMPYANSTVHVADWDQDKTYYIKCRDEFKNEDADCSVVVKPSQNFL